MKEGEETSQRTYIQEPWTLTTVWELPEGVGWGAEWKGAKGKNWDN